jgi:hypothetical protein
MRSSASGDVNSLLRDNSQMLWPRLARRPQSNLQKKNAGSLTAS